MREVPAIGVDGCRAGWVAATLVGERAGAHIEFCTFADIGALADWRDAHAPGAIVGIDVPIGLTDDGVFRRCDTEARERLGKARRSVLPPPARYLLAATNYKHARQLVEQRRRAAPGTPGVSAQAAGLLSKIAEVDRFVQGGNEVESWLVEVHPEVSFLSWTDGTRLAGKRSPAGALQRLRCARAGFAGVEEGLLTLDPRGLCLDDALDACAALWSAQRFSGGEAQVLGGHQRDSQGVLMRMAV